MTITLLFVGSDAYAQSGGIDAFTTGRGLLQLCKSESASEREVCSSYITRWIAAALQVSADQKQCIFQPKAGVDAPQFVDVTVKYLENHPSDSEEKAAFVNITAAMMEAYPCSQ